MTTEALAAAARPRRRATGVSACFGTFGELLQGMLPEPGGDFLVTLPIAQWSVAMFQVYPDATGISVHPPHKTKARRMAELVLDALGVEVGGSLVIDSTLLEGKGLASSSADLVATARAVGNALGRDLPDPWIERLLFRVEPTDGVLYRGLVAYNHRTVNLVARLGSLPEMTIVGVDEGGRVDTVAFNRRKKPFSATERQEYARLLERLTTAVSTVDLAEVGAVATRSAVLNQTQNPKRTLPDVLRIAEEAGALGVVATHSGTMLGIMLDPADPGYVRRFAAVLVACSGLGCEVSVYRSLTFRPA